ncbi:probable aspartyl protease At4g16563 [Diospyros lotus]|uniref:probable aspartyl protease At4g16563 n=1 Tax=Diospyros lotus TaxID=55363 RepID=UPI0022538A6D|nr:probable aspartyl protease At4g16563 [Diospyros lotus]
MASPVFFIIFSIFLAQVSISSSEILLLRLTHSLSTAQFNNTHHLLKSTTSRSAARHRHHHHRQGQRRQVSLPLSPGSDYTLSFSLGSDSPQTISLYMDTGSDLVWFPCHPFECILCDGEYNPATVANPSPLNLSASAAPVTCKSRACSAAHSALSSSDLCAAARCPLESIETSDCASFSCPPFYYAYGDGSLVARLYSDSLSIPMSSPSLILNNFTFGCANTALGEPIGVAGFGRGILSLPAQLASFSPHLGNQFSYCLVSHSFDASRVRRPSPLILGRRSLDKEKGSHLPDGESEFVYTPMLDNPKHPYFYSVGLEAVSVGNRRIPAPESLRKIDRDGNGGIVVDSGTTFTVLPAELYDSVVGEFTRRMGRARKRASVVEEKTGLSPCYYLGESAGEVARVPAVVLHFGGNSSVALPRKNYLYEFLEGGDDDGKGKGKRKVGCVMVMSGGDLEEGGPAGTLGNYQQQGFEVVYDLEERRVGFARRKCASLWDTLNKRS